MKFFFVLLLLLPAITYSQDNTSFPPPAIQPIIYAIESDEKIIVDGKLSEAVWQKAPVIDDFYRNDPRQGGDYLFHSVVRIVYDKKNVYFGFFCKDTAGRKGVRVQDYRRDFLKGENDAFSIQLDPQNLKRFCVSFQVTPLGTQRDLQSFDDLLEDTNWDALWRVKTNITDSGWYAEVAIPFKSLRYEKPKTDSAQWNITFARVARRDFEQTVFPRIPQNFSPNNMIYGASLRGLAVPPPSINLTFQPYMLYQHNKNTNNSGTVTTENIFKAGGEIKWAVNPHSVLDLTVNTDFAQADIDRAVNNLTRFNILFPERRQFFLENQGVFAGANASGIKPFFSRTIGLSNEQFNSAPVPIDAGIRYVERTKKRAIAGLYIHQRATSNQGAVNFGVARFLKNYSKQNNIGIMVTHKIDEGDAEKGFKQRDNTTLTVDGVIRPGPYFTIEYLASVARDNSNDSIGFGSYLRVKYDNNKFFFYYKNRIVDRKYVPGMGFVSQNDVIYHQTVQFLRIRPKGKKWNWIREYELGFDVDYYQNASDLKFQQNELYIYPLYIITKNGAVIEYALYPTWQNINFDFSILGSPIEKRRYYYNRHEFEFRSNQSKKIGFNSKYVFGKYYDGNLQEINLGLRLAPLPGFTLTADYTYNKFKDFGFLNENFDTHLYGVEARGALNANIQGSVFYQYNSFSKQGQWNVRGSWQFAPLSFLYIVFNERNFDNSLVKNQSVINKITYLKQF